MNQFKMFSVKLLLIWMIFLGYINDINGVKVAGAVRPGTGNPSPRLPRTSASQLNNGTGYRVGAKSLNQTRNGNLRTRFFLYKLPPLKVHKENYESGLRYMYILPNTHLRDWTPSKFFLTDVSSLLGRTLGPVLETPANLFISYNYNTTKFRRIISKAYSKGILSADMRTGFWLIHSVNRFPAGKKLRNVFPTDIYQYGQMFLCLTLSANQINLLATQFQLIQPKINDYQVPSTLMPIYFNINQNQTAISILTNISNYNSYNTLTRKKRSIPSKTIQGMYNSLSKAHALKKKHRKRRVLQDTDNKNEMNSKTNFTFQFGETNNEFKKIVDLRTVGGLKLKYFGKNDKFKLDIYDWIKLELNSSFEVQSGRNVLHLLNSNCTQHREQQLLNIFEVVISTLEGKLKRIDNLDKAVEHLMRRVEQLDNRVGDNILKTDSVISKLRNLDNKISLDPASDYVSGSRTPRTSSNNLDSRLVSLDQKVTDIDSKLEGLKNQIDNNFLQVDDINAEASEKKPISMNVIEITKAMNAEVMNHMTNELGQLRIKTDNIDKKLQFHINIVSDNVGRMLEMVGDIHEAVVDHHELFNSTTTTQAPIIKTSKIDALVKQIKPIMSVSEKMDEVWDVVVGTKSSVDEILPKSDKLLSQTQRQERAIGEIHQDLKTKTNLIITNLDMVERRLKKQEDDVSILAQRPVPAELLLDPTIDRLVEYDSNRYSVVDDFVEAIPTASYPPSSPSTSSPPSTQSTSTNTGSTTTQTPFIVNASQNQTTLKPLSRKGGIIFPSVKNKPSVQNNTTFTTDYVALKDIKGFSCVDLLNAGMRQSGVFYLQIRGTTYWFLKVYCEQEIADGGWTVIQRRDEFGEPRENFNRDWSDYKNGFGDPAKEFWLGNENIYMLTNNEDYALRVELEDFEGNKRYAQYSHFKIHAEADYYKLEIDGYEGNAGDSLNDPWYGSNNSPFSTYNRDNDRSSLNCASMLKGGWWWKSCGRGLNGLYLHDPQDLTARQGIVWFRWRGWDYTLKKATMMIRPRGPQMGNNTGSVTAT